MRLMIQRFSQPRFIAAFAACAALCLTAACGNNDGNSDQEPKIVSVYAQGPVSGGINQASFNQASQMVLSVTVQDPSHGNVPVLIPQVTVSTTPQQNFSSQAANGATAGAGFFIFGTSCVLAMDESGKAAIGCLLAWAPQGATAIQRSRCQSFQANAQGMLALLATSAPALYTDIAQCAGPLKLH